MQAPGRYRPPTSHSGLTCVSLCFSDPHRGAPSYLRFSCSALQHAACLLWPRLTSGDPISTPLDADSTSGRPPDLPGYDALTFTLMSVGSTPRCSVQVSGFASIGLLAPPLRLVSASCTSDQRFACGFLQIPPRDGHPCRPANTSPCRACRGLPPPSECALPGAPKEKAGRHTPSGLVL
jgi:hypothetical protein